MGWVFWAFLVFLILLWYMECNFNNKVSSLKSSIDNIYNRLDRLNNKIEYGD